MARSAFADPVKPRRSTTGSMGPLMGTNKAAWGVKLLLTTVWVYQVDCGSFCALLKTQHCCLSPCGWYIIINSNCYNNIKICDRLCENRPSSHPVVIRETLVRHEVLSCPQMVLTIQPGRRDIIPVKSRIPGP